MMQSECFLINATANRNLIDKGNYFC